MQKKYLSSSTPRFVDRKGSLSVTRLGTSRSWSDLYHRLLKLSWGSFLTLIPVSYLAINAIFALLYLADNNGIENAKPGSFRDAFFFSVQTMSSIGYGAMYPKTPYANTLVVVEALVGLLITAVSTGLVFARFSLPTARVLFSKVAVIDQYDDVPTLMFRAANQRGNFMLEAKVKVSLIRNEITKEGKYMRRFYDLKLVRAQSPAFALTWTVMHCINENSPLYEETPDSLEEKGVELVVTLMGIDETLSQTVHARYSYVASEILWNAQFVDILSTTPDGSKRVIDMKNFHNVVSI
ncbi:MAG: ion channel [Cyanobacteria bacterium P01_A01_bin.80]